MPAKSEFSTGFWIMLGVVGALVVVGIIWQILGKAAG